MKSFWESLPRPIIALAPMAGVTDEAFRRICRRYGADVVYNEMISSFALHYNDKKTLRMLRFANEEHPIVCQLMGNQATMFPQAVKKIFDAGFDGVDINFGCPAKKVAGDGGGVALMRDLPKCREIIERTLESAKGKPVSLKIRRSINKKKDTSGNIIDQSPMSRDPSTVTAIDFMEYVRDLPIAAVMIHGRSYEHPFDEDVDYAMIRKIVDCMPCPVLGNGGIRTPEDAKTMLKNTNAAGIGLARGLYGNPALCQQIREYCSTGKYVEISHERRLEILREHAQLSFTTKNRNGIIEMRKHFGWYVRGFSNAGTLRKQMCDISTLQEIEKIIAQLS